MVTKYALFISSTRSLLLLEESLKLLHVREQNKVKIMF